MEGHARIFELGGIHDDLSVVMVVVATVAKVNVVVFFSQGVALQPVYRTALLASMRASGLEDTTGKAQLNDRRKGEGGAPAGRKKEET